MRRGKKANKSLVLVPRLSLITEPPRSHLPTLGSSVHTLCVKYTASTYSLALGRQETTLALASWKMTNERLSRKAIRKVATHPSLG